MQDGKLLDVLYKFYKILYIDADDDDPQGKFSVAIATFPSYVNFYSNFKISHGYNTSVLHE